MEVAVLVLLSADDTGGRDGGLGDQVVRDLPLEVGGLEVAETLIGDTVRDADVDAVGGEHTVDLGKHRSSVGTRAVTTEDGVEGALVDDSIEGAILVLQLTHIHLLVNKGRVAVLVHLSHLLHDGEGDIDVRDVGVAILEHLLRQACT